MAMIQRSARRSLLLVGMIIAVAGLATIGTTQTRLVRHVSPVIAQPIGQTVSPSQMRALETRVSDLRATAVVDTERSPAAGEAPVPTPPDVTAEPEPSETEEAPTQPSPRPVRAQLQYVPTDANLDRQVASVLTLHNDVRKLIGSAGSVLPFPGMLRQVEQSGEEIQLKVFGLSGKKLSFDAEHQMFSGTIWLGVAEIVGGRPPRTLVTPVDFEVLDADYAEPGQVRVLRSGSPYKQVTLRLAAAMGGGSVTVISNLVPEPIKLDLPVNPTILIEAGQSAFEGLGLGTSEINVSLVGVAKPAGKIVTLRTTSGYLSATKLKVDENGMASTSIRSDGLGPAVITASSAGMAASSAQVSYRLPLITFLASIAGGLVGGGIRIGTRPPRRRKSVARLLMVAVLLGLLVFALYAVGVNVLPVSPSVTVGAALVFAVSGLGAFLGPSLLRRAP